MVTEDLREIEQRLYHGDRQLFRSSGGPMVVGRIANHSYVAYCGSDVDTQLAQLARVIGRPNRRLPSCFESETGYDCVQFAADLQNEDALWIYIEQGASSLSIRGFIVWRVLQSESALEAGEGSIRELKEKIGTFGCLN